MWYRNHKVDIPEEDVLTLIDGDNKYLLDSNPHIFLTSPPWSRTDRSCPGGETGAGMSWNYDLTIRFVYSARLFNSPTHPIYRLILAGVDLPLKRLQATIRTCGNNHPTTSQMIIGAIKACQKLYNATARHAPNQAFECIHLCQAGV